MILETLAIFGFMVLLCIAGYLLRVLCHELHRMHVVAKHYDAVQSKVWYREDWFHQYVEKSENLRDRVYRAERDASIAVSMISNHEGHYKHIKKAKKRK